MKRLKEAIVKFRIGETSKHLLAIFFIYGFISLTMIILRVLIARLYGQEELGIFTYFFNLVSFVFIFSSFGTPEALVKTIVEHPNKLKCALKHLFIIIIPTTIISLIIILLVNSYTNLNHGIRGIGPAIVLFIITYTSFFIVYSILRGHKRFVLGSLFSLLYRSSLIAFIFILFLTKLNFTYFFYAMSIAFIIPILFSLPILKKLIPKESVNAPIKMFFYSAFSLFLVQVSFHTLRFVDSLIIKYMADFVSLGLYSAYASITNGIRLIAFVLPVAIFPMAVKSKYKLKKSLKKLLLFLTPVSLIVLIASYILVPLLYGSQYTTRFLPIALITASFLFVIYAYLNSIFVGENVFSKFYLMIIGFDVSFSLVLSVILSIILIKFTGIIGAPIAISLVLILKILLNAYGIKRLRLVKNK